jgi:hypothetical protein
VIELLKRIDRKLYITWRDTSFAIMNLFGFKEEEDIDWLEMHNNMVEDKKDK